MKARHLSLRLWNFAFSVIARFIKLTNNSFEDRPDCKVDRLEEGRGELLLVLAEVDVLGHDGGAKV